MLVSEWLRPNGVWVKPKRRCRRDVTYKPVSQINIFTNK